MASITRTHEPALFNICSLGKTTYSLTIDGGTHTGVAERPALVFGLKIRFESAGVIFNFGVARMARETYLCLVPVCVPAITVTDLAGKVLATIHMPTIKQRIENIVKGLCRGTVNLVLSVGGTDRFHLVTPPVCPIKCSVTCALGCCLARCRMCERCGIKCPPECPPKCPKCPMEVSLSLPLSKAYDFTGAPELTATVATRTRPCGFPFGLEQTATITVPSGGSREATLVAAAYAVMMDFQTFVPGVVCCGVKGTVSTM